MDPSSDPGGRAKGSKPRGSYGGILERGKVTLNVGTRIDRFGDGFGEFCAPYGTPYEQRSLPPYKLTLRTGETQEEYQVYEVQREFEVFAGKVRPWFGQPGMGLQYRLEHGIPYYVERGYLVKIYVKQS